MGMFRRETVELTFRVFVTDFGKKIQNVFTKLIYEATKPRKWLKLEVQRFGIQTHGYFGKTTTSCGLSISFSEMEIKISAPGAVFKIKLAKKELSSSSENTVLISLS